VTDDRGRTKKGNEPAAVHVTVTEPIREGCLILITKDQINPEQASEVMAALQHTAGHARFMVMEVPEDGGISLHGPDDLTDALRRLSKESTSAQATAE
jgi:hypothetical protein